MRSYIAIGTVLCGVGFAHEPAAAEECWRGLIEDETVYTKDVVASYALANLVSQRREKDAGGSMTIPIKNVPIGGEFSSTSINEFEEQTNLDWNYNESLSFISKTVSPNVARNYLECIKWNAKPHGLRVWTERFDNDIATVSVLYTNPAGAAPTVPFSVEILGGGATRGLADTITTGDEVMFFIDRAKSEKIRLIARAGSSSDELEVPFVPIVQVTTEKRTKIGKKPNGEDFRIADDGTARNQSGGDCVKATPGWKVVRGTAQPVETIKAGPLDDSTWVKVTDERDDQVCFDYFFRPLAARQGGDFRFHINLTETKRTYRVVDNGAQNLVGEEGPN